MSELARQHRVPPAGTHGDDVEGVARALGIEPDDIVDLAQTLNPVAPDIVTIARDHLGSLKRYPDATRATAALAGALDVERERVVLTNGGAEAIALVASLRPRGWVEDPEFSLYADHLTEIDPTGDRWRSNPHNPSGRLAAPTEHADVWDEAFWPISTGTWTRGDADDDAIVIGSLTKLFACPGLRAGYVVAPDDAFAARVRARQPRWSLNGLAASILPSLIERTDLADWAGATRELHTQLVRELRKRRLPVTYADGPWVLVRHRDLRAQLATHAVLVRDCASFGMPDTFRIAIPRAGDLPRFLHALDRVLEQEPPHV